jgi:hypothetical protein
MTKEEFYKLLEEHGKGKFTVHYDQVRSRSEYECPICFLCTVLGKGSHTNMAYPSAAKKLDLEHGLMNVIVDAADNPKSPSRDELLKVLGL